MIVPVVFTATGTDEFVVELLPNCPYSFVPQVHADPKAGVETVSAVAELANQPISDAIATMTTHKLRRKSIKTPQSTNDHQD